VRVLLSDGSGLTARQVATQLSTTGHAVAVLTPDPLALTRFTRHVRKVHRVPAYGTDPFLWLDRAVSVYEAAGADVLLPTQEQVAVLSAAAERLTRLGVATAVPPFDSLARVQDKLAAHRTLAELELPQPDSAIVNAPELAAWDRLPVFVKTPIGTATTGVRHVSTRAELRDLAAAWEADGVFADGGVLVQTPVSGPLVMIQAVFDGGRLVASHANLRVREGARGGASHKRSIDRPDVRDHLAVIGARLGWHGALALDAILGDGGPTYIDVNPRLVEPGNAWRAGVDLVAPMLDIARGGSPPVQTPGRAGVATHQLLLAALGAAQHDGTRRAVVGELDAAVLRRGDYEHSVEELTPLHGDLRAAVPVVVAALATLAHLGAWRRFSSGAVTSYALTPAAWRAIVASRTTTPS
jgi:biotin carboxylase